MLTGRQQAEEEARWSSRFLLITHCEDEKLVVVGVEGKFPLLLKQRSQPARARSSREESLKLLAVNEMENMNSSLSLSLSVHFLRASQTLLLLSSVLKLLGQSNQVQVAPLTRINLASNGWLVGWWAGLPLSPIIGHQAIKCCVSIKTFQFCL